MHKALQVKITAKITLTIYPYRVYNQYKGVIILNNDNNCCERYKYREEEEKRALIQRLNRIEGQIRGIRAMVENDRYCADIITQTAAAGAAIDSFNRELLSSHINSCVVSDIKDGKDGTVDELLQLLKKLMR